MYARMYVCMNVCTYVLCMYVVRGDVRWGCSCFRRPTDDDRFLPAISMKIDLFPAYTTKARKSDVPTIYPTTQNQEQ